jgi:hypothetical protein
MRLLAWAILVLAATATGSGQEPADPRAPENDVEAIGKARDTVAHAPSSTLELHVPGLDQPVLLKATPDGGATDNRRLVQRKSGDRFEDTRTNLVALGRMIFDSFTTVPRDGVKLLIRPEGAPATAIYAKGLPEAAYALKLLLDGESYAKWVQKNVAEKGIPQVEVVPQEEQPRLGEAEVRGKDAVLAFARATYRQRRAELISKVLRSYLFYPDAESPHAFWRIARKDDESWWATMSCFDQMYAARFSFQVVREKDGHLSCHRILAGEYFKGE